MTAKEVTMATQSTNIHDTTTNRTAERTMTLLESGTSLAEGEFIGDNNHTNIESSNSNNTRPEQKHTQTKRHHHKTAHSTSRFQSVEELQAAIAADVLTTPHQPYTTFASPFPHHSPLPLIYADHTASNQPLSSIEQYLKDTCLPLYANTHTNTSVTGSQSTALVAEARQIVAEECNAKITGKAAQDVVLFTGAGSTAAVELLIDCMGLRHASNNNDDSQRPIVFVGPYEHHSNLIPWREAGCRVISVREDPHTQTLDLGHLEQLLQQYDQSRVLKMGTFSAASNVTGKVTDTVALAQLLHRYGALAFFDYATAAPYVDINMNPPSSSSSSQAFIQHPHSPTITTTGEDASKDAIFISPHKMLGGGAGTPGVLIVKKRLVSQTNAPHRSGGGTVFYVTNDHHRFLGNRVERFEGGTPHVTGIWRTGLCFLRKRTVAQEYKAIVATNQTNSSKTTVYQHELQTFNRVAAYWKQHAPNLVLLGYNNDNSKDISHHNLPIFSFLIRWGNRFLHYNYVCAVLNDVFGIQSRGGCQCAGPYSQELLGLTGDGSDADTNHLVEEALVKYKEKAELLRPGYTRLSLPFKGLAPEQVDYIMKAVVWVSKHAWALMCEYRCNHRTGEWRHKARQGKPLGKSERRWLSHYDPAAATKHETPPKTSSSLPPLQTALDQVFKRADELLAAARKDQGSIAQTLKMSDAQDVLGGDEGGEDLEKLRWYVYPKECATRLVEQGDHTEALEKLPDTGIVGAINPFRGTPMQVSPNVSDDSHSESGADKKRKHEEAQSSKEEIGMTEDVLGNNDVVVFRDGEHQGEATLQEIEEGIDDGELSENAEIYDCKSGEWIEASKFFSLAGKKAKTEDTPLLVSPISSSREVPTKAKGQKKKAPRDQTAWGKGEVAAVALPTTAEGSADITDTNEPSQNAKSEGTNARSRRTKHIKPPAKLMRFVNQAIFQWDMIQEGDRLLLGLSGGKDSLSLLHCLLELKRKLPTNFEIEVCTIDPMTPSFDPSPLIPYVESLGLKYHFIKDDIVARAEKAGKDGKMVSSLCAFCARMKRGNLYNVARQNNCNKLVLAQHLDDCAESFFMSVMHNGFLRTMKANYEINAGDLSVIRPMVYCRESLMTDFAKNAKLPIINENCPACFEEPKERARVKKLLSREELNYPNFYDCIKRSLIPLMHHHSEAIMHSFTEEAVAKSRKKGSPASKSKALPAPDSEPSHQEKTTDEEVSTGNHAQGTLADLTDEQLMTELALRKAKRFRLAGAMKPNPDLASSAGNEKMICEVGGKCSHFD